MRNNKKVFAVCGSTRSNSTNLNLIKAIGILGKEIFDINIFQGLADLPHFNPDLDREDLPAAVIDFRKKLAESDGILICTPEYAMGVPGSLKNAIDWTVSSTVFANKPTALITASSSGQKAHYSLLETLHVIEAFLPPETQLLISFAGTKITKDAVIAHEDTRAQVVNLINAFSNMMNDPDKS